jgi:hypothetical protein
MGHLISGAAQVEACWHHPEPLGIESLRRPTDRVRWNQSAWRHCWKLDTLATALVGPSNCTPGERLKAMVQDMHNQAGPSDYLIILYHAVPQTLGLLNSHKVWTVPFLLLTTYCVCVCVYLLLTTYNTLSIHRNSCHRN